MKNYPAHVCIETPCSVCGYDRDKEKKMAEDKPCPQCKGLGEIIFVDSKGNRVPQTCPTCYGSGRVPK